MSMNDPLNHLVLIWYHSEPLEVTYSPNPVSWMGLFFAISFRKTALMLYLSTKPLSNGRRSPGSNDSNPSNMHPDQLV